MDWPIAMLVGVVIGLIIARIRDELNDLDR